MSNPIGWTDLTINPITGCLNNCDFCYARKFAKRLAGRYGYPAEDPFALTYHPDKLANIYSLSGKGKRVFLDSMSDWCSLGVNPDWIKEILFIVEGVPEHTFLVLTKRPDRIGEMFPEKLPGNLWVGTSVTNKKDLWRLESLKNAVPSRRFVSFEPLHGFIDPDLDGIEWVIIGAESGNRRGKIEPDFGWIQHIVEEALKLPVFMKDNLRPYLPEEYGQLVQNFPEVMR